MTTRELNVEAALRDPASVFAAPEDVVSHPALTRQQKIEILRLWEYDAAEAEVATEEGMPGGNNELLRRIVLALEGLAGDGAIGETGSSKQHGLLRRRE
jgi:hypothetical protein